MWITNSSWCEILLFSATLGFCSRAPIRGLALERPYNLKGPFRPHPNWKHPPNEIRSEQHINITVENTTVAIAFTIKNFGAVVFAILKLLSYFVYDAVFEVWGWVGIGIVFFGLILKLVLKCYQFYKNLKSKNVWSSKNVWPSKNVRALKMSDIKKMSLSATACLI